MSCTGFPCKVLSLSTTPEVLCVLVQGKRLADLVNRIHVALPKARDGKARPPVIPPGVAQARARRAAGERKQTEKDLQVSVQMAIHRDSLLVYDMPVWCIA
jgi:hypothetical protein